MFDHSRFRSLVRVAGCVAASIVIGACGSQQDPGEISPTPRSEAQLAAALGAQRGVAGDAHSEKQILFGDLHVHTTYSLDAFMQGLPLVAGDGAHPPADACDFARHCSALDFFSITDHARDLTPTLWAAEKDAVRQCNAVAGDPDNPDLVAFHGFEWTQIGRTAETHYGHKNVIFRGQDEGEVPPRAITSVGKQTHDEWGPRVANASLALFADPLHWRAYRDLAFMYDAIEEMTPCPEGVPTGELPPDCREDAPTPDLLFRKLEEGGYDSLVIPHGNAWGSYAPPGTAWDKQLAEGMHDPARQRLVEVMSGHGNSEPYRSWREFERDENGEKVCPEPTPDYLPCCWQAGEVMRARCGDLPADECEARVSLARRHALDANTSPDRVISGTGVEDWLDCGQDRRGFKPAYGYRPRGSTQYALALSRDGAEGEEPRRLRFGLVGSSDNHSGRSATGYKQGRKKGMSDILGPRSEFYGNLVADRGPDEIPATPRPVPFGRDSVTTAERISSFFYPGGTVAVHASGRDRDSIWDALYRRETYATSGPRILLWFDFVDAEGARHPMGSEHRFEGTPRFEVRAAGDFEQLAGCPEEAVGALSTERVQSLCLGECYHPGERRRRIDAIEVVRIRPQQSADEAMELLIDDPWKRFDCAPDEDGCRVEFSDPEYATADRDTVYYVRALQEPTPALNGATLRAEWDDVGNGVSVDPCYGDYRSREGDTCLAPVRERAWSSPIFLDRPRS